MKPTGWRTDTGCRSTRRSSDAPAPIHAIITWRPGEQSPCIGCARPYIWRMPSSKYALFEQAMRTGKQVVCVYKGLPWEVCPIILGHSQGKEKALTYQFGGRSSQGLPAHGAWRCLFLAEVSEIRLRDGPCDLTGAFWTKLCEKLSLERSFGHAEEEI